MAGKPLCNVNLDCEEHHDEWLNLRNKMELSEEFQTDFYKEMKKHLVRIGGNYANSGEPILIGASSAAIPLGVGFISPEEDMANRRGIEPEVEKNEDNKNEIFERGHIFENAIALALQSDLRKEFPEKSVKFVEEKLTYGCSDTNEDGTLKYPWAVINTDGFLDIDGKFYLNEIKTTSSYKVINDCKNGILKKAYEIQCRYINHVLNTNGAFICIAWGINSHERCHFFIERDLEKENAIMEVLSSYVKALEDDTEFVAPEENIDNVISYLCKFSKIPEEETEEEKAFDIKDEDLMRKLDNIDEQIASIDSEREGLVAARNAVLCRLFPLFEDKTKGVYNIDDDTRIYVDRFVRIGYDKFNKPNETALKKDYPDVYDECQSFDKKKLEKKHHELYEKYKTHGATTGKNVWQVTKWVKGDGYDRKIKTEMEA